MINCGYCIRSATITDVDGIREVEHKAASVFSVADLPMQYRQGLSYDVLFDGIKNKSLWVTANEIDRPVGFALAVAQGADLHLEEVSVEPDSSRQGLGRALVETVVQAATDRHYRRVTLTTFTHLIWNRPFYASCGFEIIEDLDMENRLRSKLLEEKNLGLTQRVAMVLKLTE